MLLIANPKTSEVFEIVFEILRWFQSSVNDDDHFMLRQVMLDIQMRPGSEISLPLDPSFGVVIYILEVTSFAASLMTDT